MPECEHGQLARACNICEYEREIAEIRTRVKELEAENKRLKWLTAHEKP
jgi:U3 small nucleolar ribonucleoprotein component